MRAALRGSYTDVIFYKGFPERYPEWFEEEFYERIFTDEFLYTFYVPRQMRTPAYYEKKLIDDYSVFLRRSDGHIHLTDFDTYKSLYHEFRYDGFENSALAALHDDTIEYVECHGGKIMSGYPDWFYEYFTESFNNPSQEESIFIDRDNGEITVSSHCAILRNKYGELRMMDWNSFIRYYDPDPGI